MQGTEFEKVAQALRDGDLDALPITEPEKKLMRYVEVLTVKPYSVTDGMIQELRDAGWTDAHIAEASYDCAFFNMMVRVADAFGAKPPGCSEEGGIPKAAMA